MDKAIIKDAIETINDAQGGYTIDRDYVEIQGDRIIYIETYGLLEHLIKGLDCMALSARERLKISTNDFLKILKGFSCDESGQIITNFGVEGGINRISVYQSAVDIDKLKESCLEWHYEDEEDKNANN
jgi:hypothetical protein